MTPDPTGQPATRLFWIPPLVLLLAGGGAYSNSFQNALALDDLNNIIKNPGIQRLWPLSAAFSPPPGPISFCTRPVLNFTMAWDYAHAREAVAGYRRTNLMLHLLTGLTLMALLGSALRSGPAPGPSPELGGAAMKAGLLRFFFPDEARLAAFVAALIWLVHPLNTAAVNYLSQRGELLSALFLFAMMYGLTRAAVERAPAGSRLWAVAAVLFCLLGMGSKETMLAAPLLALIFDRVFLAPSGRALVSKRGWLHAAFWLTALWPLLLHLRYSPHIQPKTWPPYAHGHYLLTQCWGLIRLIRLAFWPRPLVFFYGMSLITSFRAVWPQALMLLLLGGLTVWALAQRSRAGVAGAFFFGLLAPSSTIVPILGQPVAEHRMYGPLAALVALVVVGLFRALGRLRRVSAGWALLILGVFASVALGLETYRRNAVYRDQRTLWQDTVQKVPQSAEPRNNYANALWEAGCPLEAVEQYRAALRLKPDYLDAHNNLATLLAQLGRTDEALAHLREALRLRPADPRLHHNLASVLEQAGRCEEALEHFERVLEAFPGDPAATAQLAHCLSEIGRGGEALDRLREALRARPGDPLLENALGVQLCRLGRPAEAVEIFRAILTRCPALVRARFNLGRALFEAGRMDEAAAEIRRILEQEPDAQEARALLDRISQQNP